MMKMVWPIGRNGIKRTMDRLVNWLFRWERLRTAIFNEVNMYNSLTRIMADPEEMKTATAMWEDVDGWRGWSIRDNKYYFHDTAEKDLMDLMEVLMDKEESNA